MRRAVIRDGTLSGEDGGLMTGVALLRYIVAKADFAAL